MYKIIDGKKVASEIKKEIAEEVAKLKKQGRKFLISLQFWLETMAQVRLMLQTK